MADSESIHIGGDVNVTDGDFVSRDKVTIIYQTGPVAEELTPAQLAEIEARYRVQVIGRYNRLGFAGLGVCRWRWLCLSTTRRRYQTSPRHRSPSSPSAANSTDERSPSLGEEGATRQQPNAPSIDRGR